MKKINRRSFMRNSSALGVTGSTIGLGTGLGKGLILPQKSHAQSSEYKALVCLFFLGGLDHADTIIPFDDAGYTQLSNARTELYQSYGVGSGNSSRDRENLLSLTPANAGVLSGRQYAVPGELGPLRTLFDSGELAFVGSVGPLIEPVTRQQFADESVALPANLFSHNDQQSIWQTFGPEGTILGWGGRFIDAALRTNPNNDQRFVAMTTSQNAAFLSSQSTSSFNVSPFGHMGVNLVNRRFFLGFGGDIDQTRQEISDFYTKRNFDDRNLFQRDFANLQGENIAASDAFTAMFNAASVTTEFPNTSLGRQLEAIARTISINSTLGVNRQIFYASLGGFDTHSNQSSRLPGLQGQIAQAVMAFRNAMTELNLWDQVTVFSGADFGRTVSDNGDGTDHGWAGHHFVTGGSVLGQRIYGTLPSTDLNSDEYTPTRGRLIPTISVDQYAATLGRWFGLNDRDLNRALPNLGNFDQSNLGFMNNDTNQPAARVRRVAATAALAQNEQNRQNNVRRNRRPIVNQRGQTGVFRGFFDKFEN